MKKRIPIYIHPLFWLVAFLIGWLNANELNGALIWTIIIFISILVHECGHAAAAVAFGQRVQIQLMVFGGLTLRAGPKLKRWQDFLVVLCGPLAGLLLFFAARGVIPFVPVKNTLMLYMLQVTVMINLVWTLLNLLPIAPLDGGRLLGIILEGIFGFKGFKISLIISVVLASILCLASFVFGQLFMGVLFFLFGYDSFRAVRGLHDMEEQDRDASLQALLREASEKHAAGDTQTALQLYGEIREKARAGIIYSTATESMAVILAEKGFDNREAVDEAYELLRSLPSKSPTAASLCHHLAYYLKDYENVTKMGSQVYQTSPNYETAMMNAVSYAVLDETEPAIGWLECAVREGLPNLQQLLQKKEFDRIRHKPQFEKFIYSRGLTNS